MHELSTEVRATLERIKRSHRHHIALHLKRNGYFVYEALSKWIPEKHSSTLITFYVGKIEFDGRFVEPIRRTGLTKGARNLDEYIKRLDGASRDEWKLQYESEYAPAILKELSTDPRQGIASISRKVGLSYTSTQYWIKKLEKKYDIKYTMDTVFLDTHFGLNKYLAIAKFKGRQPNYKQLKKVLEANPYIQLAVSTRGAFDLFLFIISHTPKDAESLMYKLRSDPALSKYEAEWYVSYYTVGTGYIPLRDEFLDTLKESVWHRSKEHPNKAKEQIFLREYATLKELNADGTMEFPSIDYKYGLNKGSAQYTYHTLVESGMIKRVTIDMRKPGIKGSAIIVAEQYNIDKFNKNKENYFKELISDSNNEINNYSFVGDIGSPYGIIFIRPIFEDGDLEVTENRLRENVMKGAEIKTSIVASVLVGSLGFRKIDTTKTWPYEVLTKEYNYKQENSI